MKHSITILLLYLCTLPLNAQSSFSKEEFVKSITFGTFCGECLNGKMKKTYFFNFENNTLRTIRYSFYPTLKYPNSRNSMFNIPINDSSKVLSASNLLVLISNRMVVNMDNRTVYGCPDCRDGGGIYIKIDFQHKSKTVMLPYSFNKSFYKKTLDLPKDVYKLAEKVLVLIDKFE